MSELYSDQEKEHVSGAQSTMFSHPQGVILSPLHPVNENANTVAMARNTMVLFCVFMADCFKFVDLFLGSMRWCVWGLLLCSWLILSIFYFFAVALLLCLALLDDQALGGGCGGGEEGEEVGVLHDEDGAR